MSEKLNRISENNQTNQDDIFYKYRPVNNIEFISDIFENQRLYASKRENLNDPMEGLYKISDEVLEKELSSKFIDALKDKKSLYNICSFSKNRHSILMWSHYADSCKGIAIGFRKKTNFRKVNYLSTLKELDGKTKDKSYGDIAKDILSSKLQDWAYEDEYRVLTHQEYVNIEIVEVIFGPSTSEAIKNFIKGEIRRNNLAHVKCFDEELGMLKSLHSE